MQGFDVGGSHKSQQSSYEVFGVQNQARVVTEGIDHTEGVGGTGFYEDYFANEEYSISALGSDVEMNSGGAAIVATSKSGGNDFSGLYHLSYQPGEWVGDNNNDELRARGFTGNPNLLFWEGHADLGGRIVRDKLWFFAAYNHFKIDKVVSGVPQELATDIGIFDNYTGKGTWKAGINNTVIGYYQQGRKQKPQRGLSSLRPPESIQAQDSWSRMYKGELQRVMSNRSFLNVTVANFTLNWPMVPAVDPAAATASGVSRYWRRRWSGMELVHHRPAKAAGQSPVHVLPAQGWQPRLQGRIREHLRLVSVRHQRIEWAHPLLLSARRRGGRPHPFC